ncbi:MAG: adenylyl-sulfate kinase, partial [bacterium]
MNPGLVVWFTGLPCSGKTTLSVLLEKRLQAAGKTVARLDADEIRKRFWPELGYSREDRDKNIHRFAHLARLLQQQGAVALVAVISPYRATRDDARLLIGRFVEIYVKCPVEICIQRDVKGMYQKALRGEIQQFTGVSDPYEEPLNPEIEVETDKHTAEECVANIIRRLE